MNNIGKKVRMVGHLVTIKYIKTIKREWMNFGCFIDPEGSFFDTTHFPQSLRGYPFKVQVPTSSSVKWWKSSDTLQLKPRSLPGFPSDPIKDILI